MKLSEVLRSLSPWEILSMAGICLALGGSGSTLFFLPGVWFEKPHLICDPKGKAFPCSDITACKEFQGNFVIDVDHSPNNLTLQYNLLCDREYIAGTIVFLCVLASLFMCLVISVLSVHKSERKRFMSRFMIFFVIVNLVSVFVGNIYEWALIQSLGLLTHAVMFSNGSPYLMERLEATKSKALIIFFLAARPTTGLIVSLVGTLSNSQTHIMSVAMAIQVLIGYFSFNSCELRDELHKGESNHPSSFKGWEKLKPNIVFFIIYMWAIFFINMLVSIELGNTFGSSVYQNIVGVSLFEYLANFFAGSIFLKFKSEDLMKFFITLNVILCGTYFVYIEGNFFFVFLIFILKAATDISVVLILAMIGDFFPKYMGAKIMGLSMLVSRIPTLFSGYLVTFCRHSLGIHPFVLMTFVYIILYFLLGKLQKYEEKLLEENDAEEKLSNFEF